MARRTIKSMLAAVLLCLVMLPATALAAAPNGQVIYVGNENVTSGGYWTTSEDGNTLTSVTSVTESNNYIHYDADDNTLTLHNATIKKQLGYSENIEGGTYIFGSAIGVFNQNGAAELTITLEGTNTIAAVGKGIYVLASSTGGANLTITGDGSLDASASQIGIWVQSNGGNATLTIQNADVTAENSSSSGDGVTVQADSGSSASLSVNGGSLTATGSGTHGAGIRFLFGSSDSSSRTPSLTVSGNTIVRANGGISDNSNTDLQIGVGDNSSGGIVFDGNKGTVYGSVELQENLTIGEGESLTIPDGASLNTGSHEVIVNGGTLTGGDKITGTVKYAPAITTESLPNGTVNEEYSQTLAATGSDTITWSLADGSSLPAGLNLDENTGKIYGTPTTAEKSTFTVTATNTYGSASREFTLTISAPTTIPVTGVSLDQNALTLTEGDTVQLTATVEPANATNKGVTWKSSDDEIVKVDNGVVTAVAPGAATITVTTEDGGRTAACAVTVTAKTYTISASPTALDFGSVTEGYQASPAAQTVTVTNTGNQSVTLTQPASTSYVIGSLSATTLAPGGTAYFTVQPKLGLASKTYSETLAISGSGGASANAALSFEVSPRQYALTVELNGGSGATTDGAYAAGSIVQIDAGTRANYRFAGWTTSNGGTFADASSSSTSFTMPAADTTITATWQYVPPYIPPTPSGPDWDDVAGDIADAEAGGRVVVDMDGETVLPGEVLEALAGRDVTLVLQMGGGVSWEICGADVPEVGPFSDSDMGVEVGTGGIPAGVVDLVSGWSGSVQVTLAHDGEFGFALTLAAPLGEKYEGLFANAYRYDADAGVLRYEAAGAVDGEGVARVRLDHASQWAIVLDSRLHALPFVDAGEGEWYSEPVRWAWLSGAMGGYGDGIFGTGDALTRAQMAAVLYNLAGKPEVDASSLPADCDADEWYARAVAWALQEGIFSGYGDGSSFGPGDPLTREQAAAVLYNAAGRQDSAYDLSSFSDAGEVSGWARNAVEWAASEGVLSGVELPGGARELQPGRACTRSELAALMMNLARRG